MDQRLYLFVEERSLSSNTLPPFESFAIPLVTTASMSFLASATMAATISRTGDCLSVPYRRIIFGLSISDLLQSLGLIIGPISVPSDVPNCWGLGNVRSCRVAGITFVMGLFAVPMYTCFICWYHLCKLKYRMSDNEFRQRTERKVHIFIIASVTMFTFIAFTLDTFHTAPTKTHCTFATIPLGCRSLPDFAGECNAAVTARVDAFVIILQSFRVICLLGMIGMMSTIFWHTLMQMRIHQPSLPPGDNDNLSQSQRDVLNLSSMYRKEIIIQTSCYVGAFCLTYLVESIIYFIVQTDRRPSVRLMIMLFYFLPLGGLFNILVYTRPQVAKLRRDQPRWSWFYCLWLVLRGGGEASEVPVPPQEDEDENSLGHIEQMPRHSRSSINPFGVISDKTFNIHSVEACNGSTSSLAPNCKSDESDEVFLPDCEEETGLAIKRDDDTNTESVK